MATLLDLSIGQNKKSGRKRTFFNRQELRQLLEVYSRRVATGEWRDYAIDNSGKDSTFTVYYGKQKLKQHQSLDNVLKVFDSPLRLISTR